MKRGGSLAWGYESHAEWRSSQVGLVESMLSFLRREVAEHGVDDDQKCEGAFDDLKYGGACDDLKCGDVRDAQKYGGVSDGQKHGEHCPAHQGGRLESMLRHG